MTRKRRVVQEEPVQIETKLKEDTEASETKDDATKEWHYVPYNVTTFTAFYSYMKAQEMREEVMELSQIFQQLVQNVLYDSEIADKEGALSALVAEYGQRTKDLTRTKEIETKEAEVEASTEIAPQPTQPEKLKDQFFCFKETGGRLRWFAIYSNNYLDDDGKPEIISEKSHQAFTYLVKEKLVPYPELWHWHVPGTRWGVADHIDYCNGMAYASGLVDEGHEKEAEVLAGMDVLVSHGMPIPFILHNKDNDSIIEFHITREISPLPKAKAANKFTGFVTL